MAVRVVGKEVQAMFGSIAERYDLTNSVLSMGIHHLWRRRLMRLVPKGAGVRALDLCTGTGDLLPHLRARCGAVFGADFSLPMMQAGVRKLSPHVFPFLQADALRLPFPDGCFDVVTVSFGIRNVERLEAGLREIRRVLKAGGKLLILEFGQPTFRPFARLFNWYSRHVMPIIGGVLTGNRAAYEYLPETSRQFPSGADFCKILERCGLAVSTSEAQSGGIAYIYGCSQLAD